MCGSGAAGRAPLVGRRWSGAAGRAPLDGVAGSQCRAVGCVVGVHSHADMRQAESGQNQIGPLRSPAGKDRACDKACEQLEGAGWDRKGTGKFLTGYSQAIKLRRHMRLSITQYNVCHMEWCSVGVSGCSDCWLVPGFALPVERHQIL